MAIKLLLNIKTMQNSIFSTVVRRNFCIFLKTLSVLFVFLIIVSAFSNNRFDEIDTLYAKAKGRLSKQGVAFLKSHYISHNEPCEKVSDVGGWFWKCTYQKGLVVYNCFRKCRGTVEVAKYFLGLNSSGDCDSWTLKNNKRQSICYPDQAGHLYNNFGAVIAIERLKECRE